MVTKPTNGVKRRTFLKTTGSGAALMASAGCLGGETSDQGQGGTAGQTGNTATIEMWHSGVTEEASNRKYIESIIKEFEQNTGHTINLQGIPYSQIVNKFRAAQSAGNPPHIVEVKTDPSVMVGAGKPINNLFQGSKTAERISDEVLDFHKTWGFQASGNKGALLTWPLGLQLFYPVWNMKVLNQVDSINQEDVSFRAGSHNYNTDLSDIYEEIQKSSWGKKEGTYPSATGLKQNDLEYLSMYIPQFGGSPTGVVNKAATEATIDTREARNAVNMIVDFITDEEYFHPNSVSAGDEEVTVLHWANDIAVNSVQDLGDFWTAYRTEKRQMMKNGMFVPGMPHNGGTKATLAFFPAMMFVDGAFENQAQLQAAGEFLDKWATLPVENTKNLGYIPINSESLRKNNWYSETKIRRWYWKETCAKIIDNYTLGSIPATPTATVPYEIPRTMFIRILNQGMSVKKATSRAAEEINSALADNR